MFLRDVGISARNTGYFLTLIALSLSRSARGISIVKATMSLSLIHVFLRLPLTLLVF